MKLRVIKLFVLISLPLLVANVYLSMDHPFVKSKELFTSNLLDFKKKNNVNYIVLGDSHAGASFKKHLLNDEIYNLSSGGDGPREMYIKFKFALRENSNIEYAFVSCDYHMFGANRIEATSRSFYYPFIDREINETVYQASYLERKLVPLHPLFSPLFYSYERDRLKKLIERLFKVSIHANAKTKEIIWSQLPSAQRKKLASKTGKGDYSQILSKKDSIHFYKRILALAQDNNIKCIGIRFPVSPEYLLELDKSDQNKVDNVLESMSFYTIIDYKDTIISPRYFRDADHLTEEGAKLFLDYLKEDMTIW
jgi:transcriptional regulator with XRE-family HTH domain